MEESRRILQVHLNQGVRLVATVQGTANWAIPDGEAVAQYRSGLGQTAQEQALKFAWQWSANSTPEEAGFPTASRVADWP